MATILTKKKDSSGVPATADLTNSTGGAELAINTADKRLYTKNSSNVIVEVGTTPTSLNISGGVSGASTLDIKSNASVGGTLLVNQAATLNNDLDVAGGISGTTTLDIRQAASVGGAFTITGAVSGYSTLSIRQAASVGGTLLGTGGVSDADGNLRSIPQSRYITSAGKHTAASTDAGNFIHLHSSDQTLEIPAGTFAAGDIFTVVSHGQSANSTTTYSAAEVLAFKAGAETSTALITIANNGVSSVLFTSAGGCIITGNVS